MDNKISIVITDAEQSEILKQIRNADGSMPWLISLSKEEIIGDLRLDPEMYPYALRAWNIANADPASFPDVDVAEMKKDLDFYQSMMPVVSEFAALWDKVRKTMIRTGQEINTQFRMVYSVVKVRAKFNSAYQSKLAELSPYYKKFGRTNDNSKTAPAEDLPK